MRMKQLKYKFTAEYVKGTTLCDADALFRAPTETPSKKDVQTNTDTASHISSIIETMPATTEKLEEIRHHTATDESLQLLQQTITDGWPSTRKECHELVKPYWDSRCDLTAVDGLLLKGNRIVIPHKLRSDILRRIHTGHFGMERSKQRARQSCYWPGMNGQIEQMVSRCETCLRFTATKQHNELQPPPMPTQPWEKIGTDIFHLFGKTYIVITDYLTL